MGLFDDILAAPDGSYAAPPVVAPSAPRGTPARKNLFDDAPDAPALPIKATSSRQTAYGPRPALAVTPHARPNLFADIVAGAPSSEPVPGVIDTLGRSVANAATFGLADRGAALGEALTGIGGEFGEYSKNLAHEQELTKAANEQHPIASVIGTLGGALLNPVGAEATAPTLAGRVAQGVTTGAAQGLGYGIGSSQDLTDLPDVAKNAIEGAGAGAVLGGAAAPVVEGIAAGAGALARHTGIPQAISGLIDPEGSAARAVAAAIQRDRQLGSVGLQPQEFDAAIERGQPVVTADLGGKTTQRLARTAANMSPEAGQELQSVANRRFETQASRIADQLTGLGGGNSVETLDSLRDAARRANRPLYQKAYDKGASGVWSPELARLSEAPAVQSAIRAATQTGANSDIASGFRPTKNPFQESQDGTMRLGMNKDGETPLPALQFWDHVKRNLDDMIGTARRSGQNNAAATLSTLKNNLLSELDNAVPSYAAARGQAAKAFGAEDALEAGKKFVTAKGQNHEYARTIAGMSKPERELFAHGFLSELENKVKEAGDRSNVINTIFNSPPARERVEMTIGRDRARQLEMHLHVERVMDQLRNAVTGGSNHARQLADMALAPAIVGGGTYLNTGDMNEATLAGATTAVLKYGVKGINAGVMQRIGEMLASSDPEVYRRAMITIQNNRPLSDFFKSLTPKMVTAILANAELQSKKPRYRRDQ